MRKSKNKSKSFNGFKQSVWLSGFLLIFFIGELIYFLLILTRLPDKLSRIILIIFHIFMFIGSKSETRYEKIYSARIIHIFSPSTSFPMVCEHI